MYETHSFFCNCKVTYGNLLLVLNSISLRWLE